MKRDRIFLISAILVGGTLEWYELYLFIHWSKIFSKLFFNDAGILTTYNILFVFFVGVLGRPVGALLFGNIGDRLGRKLAFTMSIGLMVVPSFLIAGIGWILPGTGVAVAIILCILRFIQGMAVGAELPGSFCYLAECAPKKEKAFICSFAFIGPHMGILLSQLENFFMDTYFSQYFIENYGWRLSFVIGGIIALIAVIYRSKLDESPEFALLKKKKLLSKNPIIEACTKYWKQMLNCFFTFLVSVVVFFMYTIFIEVYLDFFFETNKTNLFIIVAIITISEVFALPLWGMIGDRYSIRRLLVGSTVAILFSSVLLFFYQSLAIIVLLSLIILISLNIQSALMPVYIIELFPAAIRYTGIAISVSICDSLIGGGVPWLGGLLAHEIGFRQSFVILTFIAASISICAFLISKNKNLDIAV